MQFPFHFDTESHDVITPYYLKTQIYAFFLYYEKKLQNSPAESHQKATQKPPQKPPKLPTKHPKINEIITTCKSTPTPYQVRIKSDSTPTELRPQSDLIRCWYVVGRWMIPRRYLLRQKKPTQKLYFILSAGYHDKMQTASKTTQPSHSMVFIEFRNT